MKTATRQTRRLATTPRALLLLAMAAAASQSGEGEAGAQLPSIQRRAESAANAISALDLDEARSALAVGDPNDVAVAIESGRLALYEGRCDDALVLLGRPDILRTEGGASLYDIARGCARVTAATVVDTDEGHAVVVRYQDEADRALTPLIVETVAKAREALTRDLGVTWPKPTRVTVVRDLMSLSAMTGLPQKSAETTGTVAVAKWGRVTLLSPRASEHGFPWRDTLAHELTHLAVTRASADRAPLWLQEGVAKREEVRWREPGPYDNVPSPDAIVARGFEMKLGLPLDDLGPSIAMLPSADAAMVAFAEVTSFVRYLASTGSPDVLPTVLKVLRKTGDTDAALRGATGLDLHQWDAKWRAHLASTPHDPLPPAFGLGHAPPDTRELRDRVRLAQLLGGRSHPAAALQELAQARGHDDLSGSDPSIRSLKGSLLAAVGRTDEAKREVADPRSVLSSYGPWWALRGRLQREEGATDEADASFVEAVATDPFDVQAACEVDDKPEGAHDDSAPDSPAHALCEAARARHEPPLGRE